MSQKITFILGAGSSKPYGFPTGIELRNLLMKLDPENLKLQHELISNSPSTLDHPLKLLPEDQLRQMQYDFKILERIGKQIGLTHTTTLDKTNPHCDFAKVFKYSGTASIDTFLSHRSDYAEIGKKAIASTILDYEKNSALDKWDWYGLLWSKIKNYIEFQGDRLILKPIPLHIVTFNYDRSLEYFLWKAIQNTFRTSEDQAFNLMSEINIIHFYGSLGPLNGQDAIPYGSNNSNDAAKYINVIPYERSSQNAQKLNPDQEKALDLIHKTADVLVYMGFGFDEQNCKLLKLACLNETITIHGTTLGLTPFEKRQFARKYFNIKGQNGIVEFTMENYGCMELIRNKPIFN
jgi:hypothetical protein